MVNFLVKLLFIFNLISINSFLFQNSLKLSSGKTISFSGNGPPVLFGTGLYGTMPQFIYSNFVNDLKKNLTIININGNSPIVKSDIEDITNAINSDKISYIGHSSFNYDILESKKINAAILLDPLFVPLLSFNGFNSPLIKPKYNLLVLNTDKLINSDNKKPPEWQFLNLHKSVEVLTIKNVGHPDLLDDRWANIAQNFNLWDMAEGEKMNFNNWKFNSKKTISNIRKEYRKELANKIINFIENI